MDRRDIGERVAALRRARGLSLRAAAQETGMSHAYIDQIERAAPNANVTIDRLDQLVTGLGGRLDVRVVASDDRLGDVADNLSSDEREVLHTFARAILVSRQEPKLGHILEATSRMLLPYLPADDLSQDRQRGS